MGSLLVDHIASTADHSITTLLPVKRLTRHGRASRRVLLHPSRHENPRYSDRRRHPSLPPRPRLAVPGRLLPPCNQAEAATVAADHALLLRRLWIVCSLQRLLPLQHITESGRWLVQRQAC